MTNQYCVSADSNGCSTEVRVTSWAGKPGTGTLQLSSNVPGPPEEAVCNSKVTGKLRLKIGVTTVPRLPPPVVKNVVAIKSKFVLYSLLMINVLPGPKLL